MKPTIGRLLHYKLSASDAEAINRRRTTPSAIAARIQTQQWPLGAQAHIGNGAYEGAVVPLTVVVVHDEPQLSVNGQATLDGTDTLWVTSAHEGTEPGTWSWPPKVS